MYYLQFFFYYFRMYLSTSYLTKYERNLLMLVIEEAKYSTLFLSARLVSASASISPFVRSFVRLIFDHNPQFHYILYCVILKI